MEKENVVIMVPLIENQQEQAFTPSSGATQALLGAVPLTMEQIGGLIEGFPKFSLDTIELHVKGAAKTGGITQLVVGLSGEAGIKLVLKRDKDE
ncbi:hypothetical protein HQN90_20475 [Paenibacillus alba]|uniref:hypothetical protein n=1 Tax=Paenibacillus alba TaxID=1197127 RepID=UPI001564C450|nr:hypothetical protein [Paenibacillus alba]NQX68505.1 hypothetical protein [Paenibacillus alba]